MPAKRQIEVFSAGCPACEETLAMVRRLACPSCEAIVRDMRDTAITAKAAELEQEMKKAGFAPGQTQCEAANKVVRAR